MLPIAHRINTIEELKQLPSEYGVELDLRDYNGEIVIQHDPLKTGDLFKDYLKHYHHGMMILNVKCERIEFEVLKLLKEHNITNYFFLDCSFPMIITLLREGETNIALRFSEFERFDQLEMLKNQVKWVWLDSFSSFHFKDDEFKKMKEMGYKLCMVSPELQGRDEISHYVEQLSSFDIKIDAVCSKHYHLSKWMNS